MTELQKIRERATERVNTVMASQDRAELLRRLDRAIAALKAELLYTKCPVATKQLRTRISELES